MKKVWAIAGLIVGLASAGSVQAQVDLSQLDKDMKGPRSQVLVLGSAHLSQMGKDFRKESLAPLIDRLVAFKPDIITVESISGEQCEMVARYPTVYSETDVDQYCISTDEAKVATGLDVPAAIAAVRKTLADWPETPTPAQRRHLAALFMAFGENESALVQWLQLPESERHAGESLNDSLVAKLNRRATQNNEGTSIGVRVATRLGLQQLYSIDDHTGDNITGVDGPVLGKALQQAWDASPNAKALKPIQAREDELTKAGDMLGLYRYMNRPEVQRARINSDAAAALGDTSPQHYGQMYVSAWETRNLRMVSNIRATLRDRPGARVLSIVGAMHKPWFDNLLGMMQGVEIVDAEQVLK
ncbi:MAG: DUF5694 domain-containing protein [Lysobacter sp.]